MRYRLGALATAAALGVVVLAPGVAYGDGPGGAGAHDNVVVATNQTDGAVQIRSNATVAEDHGPKVDNRNIAFARSSCADCRTVAAAVQVVVEVGSPSDVAPYNSAVALNYQCQSCQTFAYAHQVLVSSDRPVRIDDQAREQIAGVDQQISAVVHSGDPFPQLQSELDGLTQQLVNIVQGQVNQAGAHASQADQRQVNEQG